MVLNVKITGWISISKKREPAVSDPRLSLKVTLKFCSGLLSATVCRGAPHIIIAETLTSGAGLHTHSVDEEIQVARLERIVFALFGPTVQLTYLARLCLLHLILAHTHTHTMCYVNFII